MPMKFAKQAALPRGCACCGWMPMILWPRPRFCRKNRKKKRNNHPVMKMARRFFASLLIVIAPLVLSVARTSGDNSKAAQYFAFIGTYTAKTDSKGIYSFRFDSDNGRLTSLAVAAAR